jgi:hypothetical protein
MKLGCRVAGHRFRFWADGETMRWECERCGQTGAKSYPTPGDAARYAHAFDREDREAVGHRTPLSLLPLRFGRRRR